MLYTKKFPNRHFLELDFNSPGNTIKVMSSLQRCFVLRFYGSVNPMGHVKRGQFT